MYPTSRRMAGSRSCAKPARVVPLFQRVGRLPPMLHGFGFRVVPVLVVNLTVEQPQNGDPEACNHLQSYTILNHGPVSLKSVAVQPPTHPKSPTPPRFKPTAVPAKPQSPYLRVQGFGPRGKGLGFLAGVLEARLWSILPGVPAQLSGQCVYDAGTEP